MIGGDVIIVGLLVELVCVLDLKQEVILRRIAELVQSQGKNLSSHCLSSSLKTRRFSLSKSTRRPSLESMSGRDLSTLALRGGSPLPAAASPWLSRQSSDPRERHGSVPSLHKHTPFSGGPPGATTFEEEEAELVKKRLSHAEVTTVKVQDEWLNMLLATFWQTYGPWASEYIAAQLEYWTTDLGVEVESCTVGKNPIAIKSTRGYPKADFSKHEGHRESESHSDEELTFDLDLDIQFVSDLKVKLLYQARQPTISHRSPLWMDGSSGTHRHCLPRLLKTTSCLPSYRAILPAQLSSHLDRPSRIFLTSLDCLPVLQGSVPITIENFVLTGLLTVRIQWLELDHRDIKFFPNLSFMSLQLKQQPELGIQVKVACPPPRTSLAAIILL